MKILNISQGGTNMKLLEEKLKTLMENNETYIQSGI